MADRVDTAISTKQTQRQVEELSFRGSDVSRFAVSASCPGETVLPTWRRQRDSCFQGLAAMAAEVTAGEKAVSAAMRPPVPEPVVR